MGTCLQGTHDQLRIGVHRQDQHFALGVGVLELLQRIQAAGVLHRQVQQDDIGLQGIELCEYLRAVGGLANHRIAGDIQDQCAHTRADQGVVIYQQ